MVLHVHCIVIVKYCILWSGYIIRILRTVCHLSDQVQIKCRFDIMFSHMFHAVMVVTHQNSLAWKDHV